MTEIEKSRLGELAPEINAEHRAFVGTFRKTVEHGIRAGELLTEAKAKCSHGTWLPWLEKNFEGSVRTAQEYMRLYDHREEIRAKTRDAAHLSISGALKELAAPARPDYIPPEEWETIQRASELAWWGQPDLEGLPDNVRRGFVAEQAWRAMMEQGRRYAEVLHETQESIGTITPELVGRLQDEADKLRWWVGKVEWIESIVRACDWPPGRGMPDAAFDEEEKHLPLSALYSPYEDGIPAAYGLCSPRARIREFCGPVV